MVKVTKEQYKEYQDLKYCQSNGCGCTLNTFQMICDYCYNIPMEIGKAIYTSLAQIKSHKRYPIQLKTQMTNKQYDDYMQIKKAQAEGKFFTPEQLEEICKTYIEPTKIGEHILELLKSKEV